jgi:alkyldihydroxyacetonephosphate synthase
VRRWNGWGDEANDFPLKPEGAAYLRERLGPATRLPDVTLEEVLAKVPPTRMPEHPAVSTDPEARVRHARGQSFADWLAMRGGDVGRFPDGVAFPESSSEVRELLEFCGREGVAVIPYGGGTSVAGHVNVPDVDALVLTIDLGRMDKLLHLDTLSNLATFGAGAPGPRLEEQLHERGYRLGHYPQSFELSTVGGWVVTRSSGQQSLGYGRIEQLFAGGRVETPGGTLKIPTFPASAAGPDLRELLLGSEGRIGILTEVQVRVSPLPEHESFHGAFLPNWEAAQQAARAIVRDRVQLSMLRVSDPTETITHLRLAGFARPAAMLERYLRVRGYDDRKCMLTYGISATKPQARVARALAREAIRDQGGVVIGTALGKRWEHTRFRAPYIRHGMWEAGYAVDTFETCVDWNRVDAMKGGIEQALAAAAESFGEPVHVFSHLSHVYRQGSSIYTTYVFRVGATYEETFERWRALKTAASEAIVAGGGTISHHHGVGVDHAPYLEAEKGPLGMSALAAAFAAFDPDGMMNPGKLLPPGGSRVAAGGGEAAR